MEEKLSKIHRYKRDLHNMKVQRDEAVEALIWMRAHFVQETTNLTPAQEVALEKCKKFVGTIKLDSIQ